MAIRSPTWVVGTTGQVARALLAAGGRGISRAELDLGEPGAIRAKLDRLARAQVAPCEVFLAAAYTQVDRAEQEEDIARRVNAEAPGEIARWCTDHGIPLVHYSTDYVYPGDGERPWRETDPTAPLNAYGRTKLAGEQAVSAAGGQHLIFRTSWVYDADGKNFLNTMLRFGAEREELRVVADQIGAPTYAPDLATWSRAALAAAQTRTRFPSGVYHLCHSGETSWHGFAAEIFNRVRTEAPELAASLKVKTVRAIASAEFPTPARRPANSRLSTQKVAELLGYAPATWTEGLQKAIAEKRKGAVRS